MAYLSSLHNGVCRISEQSACVGQRPYAGMRSAQIIAQKMHDLPRHQLQWPAGSNKTFKVGFSQAPDFTSKSVGSSAREGGVALGAREGSGG